MKKIYIRVGMALITFVVLISLCIGCKYLSKRNYSYYDMSIMKDGEETYKNGNYVVKMTKYVYDQKMQLAAAVFKITCDDGRKPEAYIHKSIEGNYIESFGENNSMWFYGENSRAEYKDNAIYIYYRTGRKMSDKTLGVEDLLNIELFDYNYSPTTPVHKFKLKGTEEEISIDVGGTDVVNISSVGVKIKKEDFDNINSMEIVFDNEKRKCLVDKETGYSIFTREINPNKMSDYEIGEFETPIDISKIKTLIVDSVEYDV